VLTTVDGTADVKLRPGSYTVESDQPAALHGRAYQWMQIVELAAGRDTVLELTAANAEIAPGAAAAAATPDTDASFLLQQWRDSVVMLWTPYRRASGFLVDSRGLVATSQKAIGTATAVEVQFTSTTKVAGTVLVADSARDVAVIWIDPQAAASIKPVQLACDAQPDLVSGQELWTIEAPFNRQRAVSSATAERVEPDRVASDFLLSRGTAGGPVFTSSGVLIGLTTISDDTDESRRAGSPVVRVPAACATVASADAKMKGAEPPPGRPLPVEPERPFPAEALATASRSNAGNLRPYAMSSKDFDIAFITPVMIYAAVHRTEATRRTTSKDTRNPNMQLVFDNPLLEFGDWSEYLVDSPPLLLVRVTPKLEEGFWTRVGRMAAETQGVSLPPLKRFKSGFSRLRAWCGDTEVLPVHPFKLEQRISETDAMSEGLYVFDAGSFGPTCGTVKLTLFSEKDPAQGDTRTVDPNLIDQIWQDFAVYRAQPAAVR
jgi:hypothetical protein